MGEPRSELRAIELQILGREDECDRCWGSGYDPQPTIANVQSDGACIECNGMGRIKDEDERWCRLIMGRPR